MRLLGIISRYQSKQTMYFNSKERNSDYKLLFLIRIKTSFRMFNVLTHLKYNDRKYILYGASREELFLVIL